jgi:hypothetical protein
MTAISDLTGFEAFFETYLNRFGIKFVFVGSLDDFLATLSKKAAYPCLYVERPSEDGDLDGEIFFNTRLFYLMPGTNLLEADKRAVYENCRKQLRLMLRDLHENNLLDATKRFSIDYKDLYSSDGTIGAFTAVDIRGFGKDFFDCN